MDIYLLPCLSSKPSKSLSYRPISLKPSLSIVAKKITLTKLTDLTDIKHILLDF